MVVIVCPTYNERDNVTALVPQIFNLKISDLRLFVVDDNSNDGTIHVLKEFQNTYPITLFERKNPQGLGTAYRDAFASILKDFPRATHIIQMDADLSHDPGDIPRFLEASERYDLVLGSRYVRGGGVENWGMVRRLVSMIGCWYSRIVLRLPYRDLTGGFKCWKRSTLEALPFDRLSSVGYNFQIETTFYTHKQGFQISEIPIIFHERTSGSSKFHTGIILESLVKVARLGLFG